MRHWLSIVILRIKRMWWVMLLAAVSSTVGAWLADAGNWFGIADQELGAYDSGLTFFTKAPMRSQDVVIISIDDRTLHDIENDPVFKQNYGTWPYARSLWGLVAQFLTVSCHARAIVFDAMMTERKADDEAMVELLQETNAPFYLGFSAEPDGVSLPKVQAENRRLGYTPSTLPSAPMNELTMAAQALAFPVQPKGVLIPIFPSIDTFDASTGTMSKKQLLPKPPIASLLPRLKGFGLVLTETEDVADGKMRHTHFAYTDGNNTYVTLSLAVVADLLNAERIEVAEHRLTIGNRSFRINQDGTALLNYGGPFLQRFQVVSLIDVLAAARSDALSIGPSERTDPLHLVELFQNKIILIGGFAAGTADLKTTPFDAFVPGVVKHATEIDNLLHDGFIVEAHIAWSILFTFAISLCSAMIILIVHSPRIEIAWPIAVFFLLYLGPGFILVHYKVHLLAIMPSVGGTLASIFVTLYQQFFSRKERELFRELFGHYMEKELVDQMVELHKLPSLQGELIPITAFVSDNRFFSLLSHTFRNDPTLLMQVLNRYLGTMSQPLVSSGACIDKYVRGAIIALFGAPVRHPDHAVRACKAALVTIASLRQLQKDLAKQEIPSLPVHIGINTATMLVGNIGSDQLFDYTALGEGMDVAIHLEHLANGYGVSILIGHETYLHAKDHIIARELDLVRFPGTQQQVPIYELVAMKEDLTIHQRQRLTLYEKALAAYRQQRYADALPIVSALLCIEPHDPPTHLLLAACKRHILSNDLPFSGRVVEEE